MSMKGNENLCHELFLLNYIIKINIKTNSLEEYVNFVDTTREQNTHCKTIIVFFILNKALILVYLLFKYLNEYYFFSKPKI